MNNFWKNSTDCEWFRNIKNKSSATFIQFNIIDFYPFISLKVLIDCLNYAKKLCRNNINNTK